MTRSIQSCLKHLRPLWEVLFFWICASSEAPGLQEWEKSLLKDVENCGEKQRERQEDEQLVSEFPAVVLGDELPAELDGPSHGPKLLIGFMDRP